MLFTCSLCPSSCHVLTRTRTVWIVPKPLWHAHCQTDFSTFTELFHSKYHPRVKHMIQLSNQTELIQPSLVLNPVCPKSNSFSYEFCQTNTPSLPLTSISSSSFLFHQLPSRSELEPQQQLPATVNSELGMCWWMNHICDQPAGQMQQLTVTSACGSTNRSFSFPLNSCQFLRWSKKRVRQWGEVTQMTKL